MWLDESFRRPERNARFTPAGFWQTKSIIMDNRSDVAIAETRFLIEPSIDCALSHLLGHWTDHLCALSVPFPPVNWIFSHWNVPNPLLHGKWTVGHWFADVDRLDSMEVFLLINGPTRLISVPSSVPLDWPIFSSFLAQSLWRPDGLFPPSQLKFEWLPMSF
jgi:hypothetical protein